MRFPIRIAQIASSACLSLACPLLLFADATSIPAAVTADGGRYFGSLVDGVRQGYGKVEWENGALYEGGFDRGLFSGHGKWRSASGNKYEGTFRNGMMAGQGRMEMNDGSIYVGAFLNDEFNGWGRLRTPNGDTYEGEFEHGYFHGKGRLISTGFTYDGDFARGEYRGFGKLTYQDGRGYAGEFVSSEYHGKGRYQTPDGDVYEGDFNKGEFTGTGSYVLKDGARYQGGVANWQPHGKGVYTDAGSSVYQGRFVDGELVGKGRMTGKDGSRYDGEFRNWRFHGQGVYRQANGDEYKGAFAYGLYDGPGTLSYAAPRPDGRSRDTGNWRYGNLEDKAQERQVKINVETVLYNQRALLDRELAGLLPQDPRSIDMYLLTVGGDGAQEVFRREVQFVRAQFDREFGTKGRSVALINSRSSTASVPMATITSMRESLQHMAARMDKEQDILFLFLTSHGSKQHEFSLAQNGMELRGLQASELGTMLKQTGIRWKVVVVSACYSGGFIDAVKDEYTMVITAARHDRTSFGCADDNEFTYFGRAFFKESLASGSSFQNAFIKAKALVEKWEADDGVAGRKVLHSLPQIHAPAPVSNHLQRWHAQRTHSTEVAAAGRGAPGRQK